MASEKAITPTFTPFNYVQFFAAGIDCSKALMLGCLEHFRALCSHLQMLQIMS